MYTLDKIYLVKEFELYFSARVALYFLQLPWQIEPTSWVVKYPPPTPLIVEDKRVTVLISLFLISVRDCPHIC